MVEVVNHFLLQINKHSEPEGDKPTSSHLWLNTFSSEPSFSALPVQNSFTGSRLSKAAVNDSCRNNFLTSLSLVGLRQERHRRSALASPCRAKRRMYRNMRPSSYFLQYKYPLQNHSFASVVSFTGHVARHGVSTCCYQCL